MNRSKSTSARDKKGLSKSKGSHLKVELNQLKQNLLSETLTSMGNKTRVKSEHNINHDTLCNFAESMPSGFGRMNLEENNYNSNSNSNFNPHSSSRPYIHSVLKKMLEFKKTNKKISKEIIEKKILISQKENMIIQLYEELNYHLNENAHLKASYENISILKSQVEQNKHGVTNYCQNLKRRFKQYVEIIDMYEGKISVLKKERDQIIKSCDHIIEMKVNDRAHIDEELEKTNRKIDFNVNMICELEEKLKAHKDEKESQKNRFVEIEKLDLIKLEELERKYRELHKKSQEYQIIEDIRENEVIYAQMKISMEKNDKENNEIKLKEYQLKNELLQKQLEEVNMRLTGFTNKLQEESASNKYDRLAFGKQSSIKSLHSSSNFNSTRAPMSTNRDTLRSSSMKRSGNF